MLRHAMIFIKLMISEKRGEEEVITHLPCGFEFLGFWFFYCFTK